MNYKLYFLLIIASLFLQLDSAAQENGANKCTFCYTETLPYLKKNPNPKFNSNGSPGVLAAYAVMVKLSM